MDLTGLSTSSSVAPVTKPIIQICFTFVTQEEEDGSTGGGGVGGGGGAYEYGNAFNDGDEHDGFGGSSSSTLGLPEDNIASRRKRRSRRDELGNVQRWTRVVTVRCGSTSSVPIGVMERCDPRE